MAVAATLFGGILGTLAFVIALALGSALSSALSLYALVVVSTLAFVVGIGALSSITPAHVERC